MTGSHVRLAQEDAEPGWEIHKKEPQFANPFVQVTETAFRSPTDTEVSWTVVNRKAAVVVAPVTEEGKFLLIRQERPAVQRTLWEFPAGQIDCSPDAVTEDDVRATAVRELREETGYICDPERTKMISLGYFYTSQGFTTEHAYLIMIGPVKASGDGVSPDENEQILEMKEVSVSELNEMIACGELTDGNGLSLYARLVATGELARLSHLNSPQ